MFVGRTLLLPAAIAAGCGLIFGGWWGWLRLFSKIGKELHGRRSALSTAQLHMKQVTAERDACHRQFAEQGDVRLRHIQAAKRRFYELQSEFDREYKQLDSNRLKAQLDEFLKGYFIYAAKISGIGKAKKAALASFGIETAFDINERDVLRITGFGPAKTRDLVAWRRSIEMMFRFDPTKHISPSELRALTTKYTFQQKELRDQVTEGADATIELFLKWHGKISELNFQFNQATMQIAQAEADVKLKAA
jgi:DNA-binding helix-hairpin-helix protein with protein kinase domain